MEGTESAPIESEFVLMQTDDQKTGGLNHDGLKELFLKESKFINHFAAQKDDFANYVAVLITLLAHRVDISIGNKARVLAAAWASKRMELADYLLNGLQQVTPGAEEGNYVFGVAEMVKALNLLDTNRKIRQTEKKLKKLELEAKVKPQTLQKLRVRLNELKLEPVPHGSVSGSLCRHLANWVTAIPAFVLNYYALNMPKDPWKQLADILHLKPTHFTLPWFLEFAHGLAAPEDTPVSQSQNLFKKESPKEILQIVERHKLPFSYIRRQLLGASATDCAPAAAAPVRRGGFRRGGATRGRGGATRGGATRGRGGAARGRGARRGGRPARPARQPQPAREADETASAAGGVTELNLSMKEAIATYSSIDTLIWWHEELQTAGVDAILKKRLEAGEEPTFGYGKLMERIMYAKNAVGGALLDLLMPIAQKRLTSLSLPLEKPVVVCGDASGSMQVAVNTATIISSLLTVMAGAELRFFNTQNFAPSIQPKTIQEVLRVATEVQASGGTTPAACLYKSYENQEKVKYFVLVTDEEENGAIQGMKWRELFKKYRAEICPESKLVFISFLRNPKDKGQMVGDLAKDEIKCMQFKLNSSKPDLTKMDTFLALLSIESREVKDKIEELAKLLKADEPLLSVVKRAHGREITSNFVKKAKTGKEEKKE